MMVFFPRVADVQDDLDPGGEKYDFIVHGKTMNMHHLHAKEDCEVAKNTITYIPVRKIKIEPHSLMINCPYLRHDLGHVIGAGEDVALPVSAERVIEKVLFAAAEDGTMRKSELLGVIYTLKAEQKRK